MKQKINLNWPQESNLGILESVLSKDVLLKLILDNNSKSYEERKIILPSSRTCLKVLAHYTWSRILIGDTTWAEEKKLLRKSFGSMIGVGIRKDKIIKLYESREREILKEKL